MSGKLAGLMRAAERLTVDLVAQVPDCADVSVDSPSTTYARALREGFTILPIRAADGSITRYIEATRLEQLPNWDALSKLSHPIRVDRVVARSNPLLSLLGRLDTDHEFLMVLGSDGIDGIVTVFDLNQPAAHQFSFGLSLVVEAEVARLVEEHVRKSSTEAEALVDARLREVALRPPIADPWMKANVKRWRSESEQKNQLRLMNYLTFNQKIELLNKVQLADSVALRCRRLECASGEALLRVLRKDIKQLRNDIAHDKEQWVDPWTMLARMRLTYALAQDLTA